MYAFLNIIYLLNNGKCLYLLKLSDEEDLLLISSHLEGMVFNDMVASKSCLDFNISFTFILILSCIVMDFFW